MTTTLKVLLLAPHREDLFTLGRALRDSGYIVFPARYHELATDAIVRVRPDIVLIDAATFENVCSPDCRRTALELGIRVLLFTRCAGIGDSASLQPLEGFPYPLIEYSGGGHALAGLVGG